MKKQTVIDLPQINWFLNQIASHQNEAVGKRKLREMAENHTPIKEQVAHMIRKPADNFEKEIVKGFAQ